MMRDKQFNRPLHNRDNFDYDAPTPKRKPSTKRAVLNRQIQEYTDAGGTIEVLPPEPKPKAGT